MSGLNGDEPKHRSAVIFASVHTISIEQPEGARYASSMDEDYFFEVPDRTSLNAGFTHRAAAALLSRRLRVAMFRFGGWDALMVDQWVAYALCVARGELHLDLSLCTVPTCRRDEDAQVDGDGNYYSRSRYYHRYDAGDGEDDGPGAGWPQGWLSWGVYHVPTSVFHFAALRSLCLQMFSMDEKAHIDLPLLETLSISKTFDAGAGIRRLIAGCPRLADLTLEECWMLKEISILDKRLRRFAMRCCHSLRVKVDASEMKEFEYRGPVPMDASQVSLLGSHSRIRIISCNIDFCGQAPSTKEELVALRMFLVRFADSQRRLHLSSARLGCHIESKFFRGFPRFGGLRCLELAGYLLDTSIVHALAKALERTPNLEILAKTVSEEKMRHGLEYDGHLVPVFIPGVSPACLQRRVREINLVHYQGHMAQRMVANWLLQNALVLSRVSVVLPKGPLWIQDSLIREIKGWSMNQSAKMVFL